MLAVVLGVGDETSQLRASGDSLAVLSGDGTGEGRVVGLGDDTHLLWIELVWNTKQTSDLSDTLWNVALWNVDVSEAWELLAVRVDENEVQSVEVWANDAAADGLSLWLTLAALTEALAALLEEKAHTVVLEHTLHHGETLSIVSASDLESAAGERWIDESAVDFLRDTQIVYSLRLAEVIDLIALRATGHWIVYINFAE